MYPADSYEHILLYLSKRWRGKPYMCGLLFAPPATNIGKSIFDRLSDWHYRSGENFDFFCIGYECWTGHRPDEKPVASIPRGNGLTPLDFYYNSKTFNDVLADIRARSNWKYSGEADLLLVNVVIDPKTDEPRLDFNDMVALDVDLIVRENIFATASRLMERICLAADEAAAAGDNLSVTQFSDQQVLRTALRGAMSLLLDKLKVGTLLGVRHFIVGAHLLKA